MFIMVLIIIFGIVIIIGGITYKKEEHKKNDWSKDPTIGSDSIESNFINYLIGKILNLLPWWIVNILIIIFGLLLVIWGIWVISIL